MVQPWHKSYINFLTKALSGWLHSSRSRMNDHMGVQGLGLLSSAAPVGVI